MMKNTLIFIAAFLIFSVNLANAQKPKPKKENLTAEEKQALEELKKFSAIEKGLKFQDGSIALGNGLATLSLSKKYRFLDGTQAEKVLVELWNNPPSKAGDLPMGMIVPAELSLLEPSAWAVVITHVDDGHIADDDADSINYDDLLKEMQEGSKAENEERMKQGYSAMDLIGWAESPRYDRESHKLYWAKNFKIADAELNTLNYDVRVLGRTGYISMNAVAAMADLEPVKQGMTEVLPMIEFNAGKRYTDFDSSTDKIAEYGIATLITGGVLAKTGLLKVIGITLLKFSKLIIIGVIALGAILAKFIFGAKSE